MLCVIQEYARISKKSVKNNYDVTSWLGILAVLRRPLQPCHKARQPRHCPVAPQGVAALAQVRAHVLELPRVGEVDGLRVSHLPGAGSVRRRLNMHRTMTRSCDRELAVEDSADSIGVGSMRGRLNNATIGILSRGTSPGRSRQPVARRSGFSKNKSLSHRQTRTHAGPAGSDQLTSDQLTTAVGFAPAPQTLTSRSLPSSPSVTRNSTALRRLRAPCGPPQLAHQRSARPFGLGRRRWGYFHATRCMFSRESRRTILHRVVHE